MARFSAGFAVASLVWLGLCFAQSRGSIDLFPFAREAADDAPDASVSATAGPAAEPVAKAKGRKPRPGATKRQKGRGAGAFAGAAGDSVSGDDLGALSTREADLSASSREDQLTEAEIDRGIDGVFRGIERCLVLVPPDAQSEGRVVVGMRIEPSGAVTEANLKGPSPLVGGEAGACIRRLVKSIRYRSFDGPAMVAHYPMTFE